MSLNDTTRNMESQTELDEKDMGALKNLKVYDNPYLVMAMGELAFQRVREVKILKVDCPFYSYLSGHCETNRPAR